MQLSATPFMNAKITGGILAAIAALTLCFWAPAAYAEPTTSAEALEELNAQQASLDDASNRYFDALKSYEAAVEEHDKAEARLKEVEAELADMQDRLGSRARELYRTGLGSWIDVLLGSLSFTELTRNIDIINKVNNNDIALIQKDKELREESRELEAVSEEQMQRSSVAADDAYKAFQEAEALTRHIQEVFEALSAEEQAAVANEVAMQAELAAQQAANDQVVAQAVAESGAVMNSDGSVTDSSGNTYSSPSEYSAATGNAIVDRALAQLGANYVWGGVGGSDGGYDCSGFVSYALTGQNTRLGTTATFNTWNEVSDPQPGDVVVIHQTNGSQHTGIYIGNGQMVHASDSKTGVIVSDVQKGMKYVRQ